MVKVLIRIMPKRVETSISSLSHSLQELCRLRGYDLADTTEEKIAFGIRGLNALFRLSEQETGLLQRLEDDITDLEEVQSAEVIALTR
ncbi:MAG: hypothetical protein ACE5KH_03010 [Candidatus Geothermarchaeales archaeon]